MPITLRCECGKKLQAPDSAAGKRVRCGGCQATLTVPAASAGPPAPPPPPAPLPAPFALQAEPPAPPPLPAPSRPRAQDDDEDDEEFDRPRPRKRRAKRRDDDSPDMKPFIIRVAVIGAVAAAVIGAAVYYFGFTGGSAAEEQLIGDWETDPEPWEKAAANTPLGIGFMPDITFRFNKDHTFHMGFFWDGDGKWKVVGRDADNKLRVKLTSKVFGIDQSDPPTATLTFRDKDHVHFYANEPSMHMEFLLRRVGSAPAAKPAEKDPVKEPVKPADPPAPKPGTPPANPPAGPPADEWQSFTLDKLVVLSASGEPKLSQSGATTTRLKDVFRFNEYTLPWPGRAPTVKVYRSPKAPEKNRRGATVAEYVGAAALADGGPGYTPVRTFMQDSRHAASYARTGAAGGSVHLVIGDDNVVCVISCPDRSANDPLVNRLFDSVRFAK